MVDREKFETWLFATGVERHDGNRGRAFGFTDVSWHGWHHTFYRVERYRCCGCGPFGNPSDQTGGGFMLSFFELVDCLGAGVSADRIIVGGCSSLGGFYGGYADMEV